MNTFGLSVDKYANFTFLGVLGKGSFGRVYLVENAKMSDSPMALKIMDKSHYVQHKHVAKANRERAILGQVRHNNIIKLVDAFQTPKYICLVTEYFESVDLWTLQHVLRRSAQGRLTLDEGRTIAAQIFLALDYLHNLNIIYRDLKTENIVATKKGRIKMVDFGFAKKLDQTGRTATLCGTPEYLAPEIISNLPYTYAVDWWSYGILLYELITGFTPFSKLGQNIKTPCDVMRVYSFILKGDINFFDYMNADLRELVTALLVKDPTCRLGHTAGGSANIINHRWFNGIDVRNTETIDLDIEFKVSPNQELFKGPPLDFMEPAQCDYNAYFANYTVCMI